MVWQPEENSLLYPVRGYLHKTVSKIQVKCNWKAVGPHDVFEGYCEVTC